MHSSDSMHLIMIATGTETIVAQGTNSVDLIFNSLTDIQGFLVCKVTM